MAATETIQHVTNETLALAPLAASVVVAVEQTAASLPGESKLAIATQAIQAGSALVAQGSPNVTAANVAALVNVFVSIFNATGLFRKKK